VAPAFVGAIDLVERFTSTPSPHDGVYAPYTSVEDAKRAQIWRANGPPVGDGLSNRWLPNELLP
jgi:hypothetical protein